MLENYAKYEPIIYKQMQKALNGNLSHAYLFDLNQNIYALDMVMSFVKLIFSKGREENQNLYKRIDDGNYQELKIIYPDGQFIKKEQLDELQKNFSTKAIESDTKVYIIHNAEKLNQSAANSLLKFLEEPSAGIVAILLTNNSKQVLNTIVSRCQILKFSNNNLEEFIRFKNIKSKITVHKISFTVFNKVEITDEIEKFVNSVVEFWNLFENNGLKTIIYEKQYFLDIFKEKEDISNFIKCSILLYRDILNYKLNRNVLYYNDYESIIEKISILNKYEKILNKISVLLKKENLVRKNVNSNMFIDGIIIDMEE